MSKTYRFSIDLPVPATDIFRAITDERLLIKWLSEYARVSLAEGIFELWGRYLPDAPEKPATRLIEALENRSLRFTFTVRTVETTVLVELAGIDGGTQMVIVQDKVPRPDTEASLEDFWGLSLENLRRLLTGGSGPLFRDFRERARGQAVVSAQIDGAPAKVFDALINPAELDRYVATKAVVEPVTGGKVDFGWGGGPIKILEVERDRKLSYSWQHGAEPETVVTWTLEGSAGGTRLTLVHSGFGADRITDDYTTGWLYFVSSMKSMIGMGPSWRRANVHTSQHA